MWLEMGLSLWTQLCTSFQDGIRLRIVHDPATNRVMDAKTFDTPENAPAPRPDPAAVRELVSAISQVASLNSKISPLLRQAESLTREKLPENLFEGVQDVKEECLSSPDWLLATRPAPQLEHRAEMRPYQGFL